MDNFREWLSDNLRYFMLGGAILLVVLVLFFGIRACVGGRDKTEEDQQTEQQVTPAAQDDEASQDTEAEDEADAGDANPLVEASADIRELTETYYKALGDKDIDTLNSLTGGLTPAEEAQITNAQYIESYEVGSVFTKNGLEADTYVVYACFNYKCTGIETPVPALSWLYVYKDADGSLKINGTAQSDAEISAYEQELEAGADVAELYSAVNAEYEAAKTSDADLSAFLDGLGDDAETTTSGTGETVTAIDGANVRDAAEGEIIGTVEVGTELPLLGTEGEWVKVDYNGTTGYIYNTLVE